MLQSIIFSIKLREKALQFTFSLAHPISQLGFIVDILVAIKSKYKRVEVWCRKLEVGGILLSSDF